jgi:membrane protein required for colicin V production
LSFAQVFDIAAAFVAAFFVARGAVRGLTGELVSLVGLVAAVFCGWTFAGQAADFVARYLPSLDPTILRMVCAAALFFGVSIAFSMLGRLMKAAVSAAGLSLTNHVLGAAVGAARAFVIVLFIYGLLSVSLRMSLFPLSASATAWMQDSVVMRFTSAAWPPVMKILTESGLDLENLARRGASGLTPQ